MSTSARILIVEDDSSIAAGLRMNLRHEGYLVRIAEDGEAGLRLALEEPPDLVILDVMMPKMNGYEVLRELRRRGSEAAVIMLTAKALEEDKVLGLELGADDYVPKPFGLPELLARVKAVLRRRSAQAPEVVRLGAVEIDRAARRVMRDGEEIALSPRETSLLLYFLDHPGRALSRQQLIEGAWGYDYEGTDRTVDNFVVSLRKKLEENPDEPARFLTVRGLGYRFEAD